MRVGVTLPQFSSDPEPVIAAAIEAESLGLDGLFVFDHLWPIGRPFDPVMSAFPLLGALVGSTSEITVGTLVARIGILPDDVLVSEFETLSSIAPGRIVAGLGTGDSKSWAENRAYGLEIATVRDRLDSLHWCAEQIAELGVPVWLGGTSSQIVGTAHSISQHKVALNAWDATPERVAELGATGLEITWGGQVAGRLGSHHPADARVESCRRDLGCLRLAGELGSCGRSCCGFKAHIGGRLT